MNRKEEDKLFERMLAFDALSENNYFLLADVFKRQMESLEDEYVQENDHWENSVPKGHLPLGKITFGSKLGSVLEGIRNTALTLSMCDVRFSTPDFFDICLINCPTIQQECHALYFLNTMWNGIDIPFSLWGSGDE